MANYGLLRHGRSSNGSLVIAVKSKGTDNFRTGAVLSFYVLQNITLTKVAHFIKLYYSKLFQDPDVSVATVAHVSQARASTMLLILNVNVRRWSGLKWLNIRTKFHEIRSNGPKIKSRVTYTRIHTHTHTRARAPTFCHESNVTQTHRQCFSFRLLHTCEICDSCSSVDEDSSLLRHYTEVD